MQIATIGLDIAKDVFQVHGIDAAERIVVREAAVTAAPGAGVLQSASAVCSVGMEARATAHYWARGLMKLGHLVSTDASEGREAAYVKRNKNDAADAEAICEASAAADHAFRYKLNRPSSRAG